MSFCTQRRDDSADAEGIYSSSTCVEAGDLFDHFVESTGTIHACRDYGTIAARLGLAYLQHLGFVCSQGIPVDTVVQSSSFGYGSVVSCSLDVWTRRYHSSSRFVETGARDKREREREMELVPS